MQPTRAGCISSNRNSPCLKSPCCPASQNANLKRDPAFRTLPDELVSIRMQAPQKREGESNAAYARRLHLEQPELTLPQISLLSGVTEANLKQDPAFRTLPDELVSIRMQAPQKREGESNAAYARRLHLEQPQLTLPQIALLAGVFEGHLKRDPTFRTLPDELISIRAQAPQREGESNAAYARRLHLEQPRLALSQISLLSGVMENHLRFDPAFRLLPDDLLHIREQAPQVEGETNGAYARRLHLEQPQLTLPQISLLSGVIESNLKRDPAFRVLPDDLLRIRAQAPQREGESNAAYARRLHLEQPQLALSQISLLSGARKSHLKLRSPFLQTPASSTSAESANSALPESSARQSRPPKRVASEAAPALPASQDVPIVRSVRPRMTEPRGTPIEQLLESREWQIAGAMSLMRRQGLPLSSAERLAGLPVQTLGLVSDDQGWLHSHDFQAALVQSAGVDGLRLQELLAYLRQEQQRGGARAMPQGTPTATPGLELFISELEAALAATPEHAQPRSESQPSQPELAWGTRRARTPRPGSRRPGRPRHPTLGRPGTAARRCAGDAPGHPNRDAGAGAVCLGAGSGVGRDA